jgi:DNA adenine methylase
VNLPGMPHLDTYDIVAADVPWEHDNFGQAKHGAAKASYDEMPLESVEEDPQVAGWWAWGLSCWIGGGWCAVERTATGETPSEQARRPHLGGSSGVGKGVHRLWQQKPMVGGEGGKGVHRKIPDVFGRGGKGLHGRSVGVGGAGGPSAQRRPNMGGMGGGQGVQSPTVVREEGGLVEWFQDLAQRLRRVRVCCGDWKRVLTPAVLKSHGGPTGIVLDPPYDQDERADNLYSEESRGVSADVRAWAIEHGEDPDLRIVLCGYEGEHHMPASWRVREWHTSGGYASAERGVENRFRERLWFSPACLIAQRGLFEAGAASS